MRRLWCAVRYRPEEAFLMPVTVDCVDCITEGITTHRPIVSGTRKPRCATHDRAVRKRTKSRAHTRRIENHYDLTEEGYWALYRYQNGVCYICGVATGKTKRLAVDHDHSICSEHPPEMGCPRCI